MNTTSVIRTLYRGTQAVSTVVKDAGRARHIATVLAKHGFLALVNPRPDATSEDARREIVGGTVDGMTETERRDLAGRVVSMLEELGPTFVKFGQILSTRPDIVPRGVIQRLQRLQDGAKTIPFEQVEAAIVAGLGDQPAALFESFDVEPIAAASIAQVHGAVTKDGQSVVVKVQRPHIRRTVEADLSLLRFLARRVVEVFPEAELVDLIGMVREFEKSLSREMDFDEELRALKRFRHNFAENDSVHIPAPFEDLSSRTVLTMERIRGKKLTELGDAAHAQGAVSVYLDAAYQMLFKDGFFHGDLHPGNAFVEEDGTLGLIDFGMVGRLSRGMRDKLVDMLFALLHDDLEGVARTLHSIGKPPPDLDYAAFEADAIELLERHAVGANIEDIEISALFRDLAEGAVRHRVLMPSDFTMMFKAMLTTEGMARAIAPQVNPFEAARPYIEALLRERYSMERMKNQALVEAVRASELMRAMPSTLSRLLGRLESGQIAFEMRLRGEDGRAARQARAIDRASLGLISAAGSLTGAITIEHGTPVLLGLGVVPLAAFGVAAGALVLFGLGWLRAR